MGATSNAGEKIHSIRYFTGIRNSAGIFTLYEKRAEFAALS
jgi:hypothetical protein